MEYDFSSAIQRSGTSSVKYDLRQTIFGKDDVIPLWVADMDFPTPPFIIDRIIKRLSHPILGYTFRDSEFDNAITGWLKRRFGWSINSEWISFSPGIVAGLNHAVQAFTNPKDKILIQTPVYHPFFYAIKQNNRELITNPLVLEDGKYVVDFDHFEEQLKNGVKMFILCSPHNPVGRVWSKHELTKMAELCLKYKVLIISDEIHADIVFHPFKHTPLATLSPEISKETVTFNSASKTFNIAGLTTAYAIITHAPFLKQYNHQLDKNGTNHGNIFGYEALKSAYTIEGEKWLGELIDYLANNVGFVKSFLSNYLPEIKLIEPEGTYLLWLDFREMKLSNEELNSLLIQRVGIGLNAGEMFGADGSGFQRMNIGCPKSTLEKSLSLLKAGFL